MDEMISKTALLTHLRKERDEYFRAHFNEDPATGTFEASDPKVEYLSDLEERIDFIEQFPAAIEPIATLINNNQPGWTNIIETAPGVTIDVGTKLYAPTHSCTCRLFRADHQCQCPTPEPRTAAGSLD